MEEEGIRWRRRRAFSASNFSLTVPFAGFVGEEKFFVPIEKTYYGGEIRRVELPPIVMQRNICGATR
jgi:hypothetical protein